MQRVMPIFALAFKATSTRSWPYYPCGFHVFWGITTQNTSDASVFDCCVTPHSLKLPLVKSPSVAIALMARLFTMHHPTLCPEDPVLVDAPSPLRLWGSGSLVQSKRCHYIIVEADSHIKLHPTSRQKKLPFLQSCMHQ